MKNKTSFFIFLLALSFSASLLHAFDVVKDGRAKAYILLSENADEVEKFAAEEFAKYVKKMTKADIAISQKEITGLNTVRFRLTSSADFKKDPARKKLSSLGKFGTFFPQIKILYPSSPVPVRDFITATIFF